MKLLDTSELIYLFNSSGGIFRPKETYAISRATYIEFMSFESMAVDEVERYSEILEKYFHIIEINKEISDVAGALRRGYKLKLGDAIILSTAFIYDLVLATSDLRLKRKYVKIKS